MPWSTAFLMLLVAQGASSYQRQTAEERATSYLAREVPLWSKENHCFSCHNNGDGARALYTASRLSYRVPREALTATNQWLLRPLEWDTNGGDPGFSDKKLARIQFAAALAEAHAAGYVENRKVVIQGAESLLPYQENDGSWQVDSGAAVGSPVTYGAHLATFMARQTLEKSDAGRFQAQIAKADRWFLRTPVNTMLGAAAVLMALGDRRDPETEPRGKESLEKILRGQASDGGWGPYASSPPEVFDTSVVLLALHSLRQNSSIRDRIERGRAYLCNL